MIYIYIYIYIYINVHIYISNIKRFAAMMKKIRERECAF
jgi:hypothetical protein